MLVSWANALDPEQQVEERRLMSAEALRLLRDRSAECPVDLGEALALAAASAAAAGHADAARAQARDAWQLVRDIRPGSAMWYGASAAVRVARVLLDLELVVEAESLLTSAESELAVQFGDHHTDTQVARRLLAEIETARRGPSP
jgi:hypothetical protein